VVEPEWHELMVSCSNEGRWGAADDRGTLNYISAEQVVAALGLVKAGDVVSIAYDIPFVSEEASALEVRREGNSLLDRFTLAVHGFDVTHLDAVGHVFCGERAYNGRKAADSYDEHGLSFGSIAAMTGGIVTRGVLLDVARVRGVESLTAGEGISVEDVEQAERAAGVTVGEGDAVFIRSGIGRNLYWLRSEGAADRPGILAEVVPWLHARRVAVYSGDCIEQLPAGGVASHMPLHEIGLAAMGLALLDNPDVETLRAACDRHGRQEFLLVVSPLRIRGGTGSAVNPLALF